MSTGHSICLISSRQGFVTEAERAALEGHAGRGIRIGGRIPMSNGATAPAGLEALRSGSVSVFLLDLDSAPEECLSLLGELAAGAPVLVASGSRDPDLIVRAMRAGASDFLALPLDHTSLADALDRASRRALPEAAATTRRRRVTAFVGAKGGCGATTVAVNFAAALCPEDAKTGRSVILVDLDSPGGDVTAMLKLSATWSLADVAANIHRLDMDLLNSMALRHGSGLRCLASAGEGERPGVVAPDQMGAIVSFLGDQFDDVVLAGGGLSPVEMEALGRAHLVHVVTTLDFLALRRARLVIERLQDFGIAGGALRAVVNRRDRGSDLTTRDAAQALGVPVVWSIPDDRVTAERAVNHGAPFVLAGRSRIQASFTEYVSRLAAAKPGSAGAGSNHGGLGGLIRRLVPGKAEANA